MEGGKEARSPYRVEISSKAWTQLGAVPGESFRKLKEALEGIAAQADHLPSERFGPVGPDSARPPLAMVLGDEVAIYDVDPERRIITLLEITQRRSEA